MIVAAALLGAACTPPPVTVSPSVPPSFTATTEPSPSPTPAPGFADAPPGADWPAVALYTVTNDGVAHVVSKTGTSDLGRVCEGRALGMLARADGTALLVRCIGSTTDTETLAVIDVASRHVTLLAAHPITSFSLAWSPDGRSVALFELGNCPMPAPVCQTRAVIADVATGTEREILPSDYHLRTQLVWTSAGLRMFQPECAEAGCFPPERVGTFLWDGARFNKVSDMRLIASDGARFSLYERVRSLSDTSAVRSVILQDGQVDRNLTAVGPREYAIDLLNEGHALAWRPDDADPSGFMGDLREYDPQGRMLWSRPARLFPPTAVRVGDSVGAGAFDGVVYLYDLRRILRFMVRVDTNAFVVVGG